MSGTLINSYFFTGQRELNISNLKNGSYIICILKGGELMHFDTLIKL